MTQPPLLIDTSCRDIPSPIFTPRPGWGGSHPVRRLIFLAVILLGTVLLLKGTFNSLQRSNLESAERSDLETTTPPATTDYIETVRPGEGISRLAARALAAFLADRPDWQLTAAQRYRATDHLWRRMPKTSLPVGEEVAFPATLIESAISGY